ncbi:NAD(P)/FAD-dependent oxidoreductase [Alcaligenes endophyticus]|uniref:FAD-binding oxidoreductase n=1 Tax=Alcaligenes endophyticus TaxID=1929088 RepID=A0ABT8EG25_9BURK|nr:FAD-dependent oxidoreductase [Alcaligenes endophyticus]MCX5590124.1 FAD-dependent oxidoreductase [Alcaligenes endophyticus]MDN4120213.1 FAD-binding oxidoreductase [Alcaligenes endophyticus]
MAGQDIYDFVVVGAGMAGVSLAYRIGGMARTLVLEAETQPGYHSSGRSAAMFMETYGTPTTRALTRASRRFFTQPPEQFSEHPLLTDRGVLYLVREGQEKLKENFLLDARDSGNRIREISAEEVLRRVPCVQAEGLLGAVEELDAKDVDVHALLQGFLRGARQQGVEFLFSTKITHSLRENDLWVLQLSNGTEVQARTVVNAAGAWAQEVGAQFGALEVGLQPKRRSAFTFKALCNGNSEPIPAAEFEAWPAVVGIDESYYFKPDAGQLMGSPANADPVDAHDVVPEELDIAIGIDRITSATTLDIRRPTHTWAGLRSFVADGDFVIGWDPQLSGFFWLAGQGGYGIQTAPGASLLAANILLEQELDPVLVQEQVEPDALTPKRFQTQSAL